ncbi:MAG: YARHG domain-containing protein [Verrucomicrobia bacterium]|nr:YARHG domain-containing protein [Verrucomicrobiota bacterium]
MIGTYVGMFGTKKITFSIDKLVGDSLSGYSIVAANERAFAGTWKAFEGDASYDLICKEPGDHPLDGVFTLSFNPYEKTLRGKWLANDRKKQKKAVPLELVARVFSYDPKVGQFPEASTRLLKESDVKNLRQEELRIMRNEIYARHGYCFGLADMREHFDKQDWYMPVSVDIKTKLTKIELANEELIKRHENYAAEYYDDFGR